MPLDFRLTFSAIIAGVGPVEFPFKVFLSGDFFVVQLLLAKEPFPHEIINEAIVEVDTHGRLSGPTSTPFP